MGSSSTSSSSFSSTRNSLSTAVSFLLVVVVVSSSLYSLTDAQQTYINNKQLDCYNNLSLTNGYMCNGPNTSCKSYLTFRSQPPYDSATDIGYLLGSSPSEIAKINNITDVDKIPTDTLVIVPVTCSCSISSSSSNTKGVGGGYYQHNSSYILKRRSETYFSVANDTYQGLSTCQALMSQNSVDSRNLIVGLNISVPLRCACPTRNQMADGTRFLLSYLVTWRDSISSIAVKFGGSVVNEQSIYDANELSQDSSIFPFTPLLVPLKTQPTTHPNPSQPPGPPAQLPPDRSSSSPGGGNQSSSKKWVIGVGIGIGLLFVLALSGFLIWLFLGRRRRRRLGSSRSNQVGKRIPEFDEKLSGGGATDQYTAIHGYESKPTLSVRYAMDSLNLYKFEELEKATGFFSEDNRIKGSVYQGLINGDNAAIKRMKGDVSSEISILKQITHSNVIRLSGFCVHEGNTYMVYEFAENGSLSDWLHKNENTKKNIGCLGWKQRVQIAYHVADGLNYLHNYANPPYIHKDLKSSNILLDSNFRAKIANFGVARTLEMDNNQEEGEGGGGGGLQLTRHVIGTQGYMAPEYLENGVITPKLDVFSFGVVMLELLSGKEAASSSDDGKSTGKEGDTLLYASIKTVLEGENVREKLIDYIDPSLRQHEYPLDSVFSMAQLARDCVATDLNSRPTMLDVFMSISKILSSSLDWDPSNELE